MRVQFYLSNELIVFQNEEYLLVLQATYKDIVAQNELLAS